MYNIGLADDHVLLRNGLASLIESLGHKVIIQADNGAELIKKLDQTYQPDVLLLDINMPVMDGYETAAWLRKNRPLTNVLALSMYDDESAIIRMLRSGGKGYILKDCEPADLVVYAIKNGFYLV